jgi:SAM-dependent methyltransferase
MPVDENWFADEAFWSELYEYTFSEWVFEAVEEGANHILELTGVTGGDVLDLCCGPGRYSVELARRGFRVTGVDLSPFLLEKARARGREAGVEVEWVRSDMREFERPAAFDLALNVYTSFGYFLDDGDNRRVLEHVCRSLRPGGALFIEMMGKEVLARVFQDTGSRELDDGSVLFERRKVVDSWRRCRNEWTLIKNGKITRFQFEHWLYSAREFEELLRSAGFTQVQLYGTYGGDEYGTAAKRLIAVARRD